MNKHERLTDKIYKELKDLPGVDWIKKNVEYKKGECDILLYVFGQPVYYEIKSNHNFNSFKKGTEQIERWRKFTKYKGIGVYWTPTYSETFY
jgi:Holliday junction resolvase-like predicted endonuclease